MYSLAVRNKSKDDKGSSTSTTTSPSPSNAATPTAKFSKPNPDTDNDTTTTSPNNNTDLHKQPESVTFSAGNPRVEHISGTVHLYRHLTPNNEQQQQHPQRHYLPSERDTLLCILALPPDMGFSEFITFIDTYTNKLTAIRLVRREGGRGTCLVLLDFKEQQAADDFYVHFNAKPFCMLEPDILCRLLFVKDVDIDEEKSTTQREGGITVDRNNQQAMPPDGAMELPSCPVCLERLDHHVSGIVTTVCNHRFHNECLKRWGDTSCPVCRYCHATTSGGNGTNNNNNNIGTADGTNHNNNNDGEGGGGGTTRCAACNTSEDLWICLICGLVGCGRYKGSHAASHFQDSGHGYALELESQRVWDYVNDQYVHRLIQSKTDGKLVEVSGDHHGSAGGGGGNNNNNNRGGGGGMKDRGGLIGSYNGGGEGECDQCCSSGNLGVGNYNHHHHHRCDLDHEMEEVLVASKLDALSLEYNHLLVSQLESQRGYFEAMLARQSGQYDEEKAALEAKVKSAEDAVEAANKRGVDIGRKLQGMESKMGTLGGKLDKVEKERMFLKQLNDTLLANQKEFVEKLKGAEVVVREKEKEIEDLKEQVRDLMVFLEARQIMESNEELEGGTVLPMEAPAAGRSGRRGRNSSKK